VLTLESLLAQSSASVLAAPRQAPSGTAAGESLGAETLATHGEQAGEGVEAARARWSKAQETLCIGASWSANTRGPPD
jgi:hypothetical protein